MSADPRVAEVLAAEQARAAAMVACDAMALAALLHEDVAYIHATGVRHDRAQLVDYLKTGPRFLAVELAAPRVWVQGDCAIVTGELHLRLQRDAAAEPITALSLASQVWWLGGGPPARWRLALFQSTRLA